VTGGSDSTVAGPGDAADLHNAIRAGAAVYNAGEYHAAHDAWEDRWLDLEAGTADERLLHGLIQFTAVVYHARNHNWSGALGLAESAGEYLDGLTADGQGEEESEGESARGVDVTALRAWLHAFRTDPERIERGSPPVLRVDGEVVEPGVLTLSEVALAARVVCEEYDYDEAVVADAVRFAREDADPDSTRAATFLRDFVGDAAHRPIVFQRLGGLVERERRKEADVAGLFESREE
jgi:hypothetical protein